MTITATCGHDISGEFIAETVVTVKAVTREGERAVGLRTACLRCRRDYERVGLVLHDHHEEQEWLHGELPERVI